MPIKFNTRKTFQLSVVYYTDTPQTFTPFYDSFKTYVFSAAKNEPLCFTWEKTFTYYKGDEVSRHCFTVTLRMNNLELLEEVKLSLEAEDIPLFGGTKSSYKITPVWHDW